MYLLYGMSYEQYWYASPRLVITYRKLHKLQIEERNQQLWLQGIYNESALMSALASAFGGKNNKVKYLEKPIDLFEKTDKELEREAEVERKKAVENLNAWKRAMENKYGRNNNISGN